MVYMCDICTMMMIYLSSCWLDEENWRFEHDSELYCSLPLYLFFNAHERTGERSECEACGAGARAGGRVK